MSIILPYNIFTNFQYFTTAVTVQTHISKRKKPVEKKYLLIGLKNIQTGKYIIHPVSEFLLSGKRLNQKYLTSKKQADHIVPFLNFTFIKNFPHYKIKHLADLKFSHGSDFLNYKGLTVARTTLERYESTLTHFYYFLAEKGLTKHFSSLNFNITYIVIKRKRIKYIKPPFEGVIYPIEQLQSKILHDLPDELLTRRLNSRSCGISNLGMFEVFHDSLWHFLKLSQMR